MTEENRDGEGSGILYRAGQYPTNQAPHGSPTEQVSILHEIPPLTPYTTPWIPYRARPYFTPDTPAHPIHHPWIL